MTAGERLYLSDDADLGVKGTRDPGVCHRHVGRYNKAVELAGRTGGTWLDFACGSGYGTQILASVAELVVGMDRSPTAIGYAEKHHNHPRCFYRVASEANVWDVLGRHLRPDVVVCIETLEHMDMEAQAKYLHTVSKGMAPDGVLVLGCPIGNGYQSSNPWHLHEPTLTELKMILGFYFDDVTLETEDYVSTSGPAIQAWAVCR